MADDETVELIMTADGNIRNIVFVEELVAAAPKLSNWKFTALKPASEFDVGIRMAGYDFSKESLFFYKNEYPLFPDFIDITLVHKDMNFENQELITNGIFIYLDNYLGELQFATSIDQISVVAPSEATQELIPIAKLKSFLTWRQKEFIEKYEGTRRDTEADNYLALEGETENGNPILAVLNKDLIHWDKKASHPWLAVIDLSYNGFRNSGLPTPEINEQLNDIEDAIMQELTDVKGHLNVGRETGSGTRTIYLACKDFRQASKVLTTFEQQYAEQYSFGFDIFKDKYWRTFEKYDLQ